MMNVQKLTGMLGIARRAGCIVLGAEAVREAIGSGRAAVLLVDTDASGRTAETLRKQAEEKSVPLYRTEKGLIGNACGKAGYMTAAVLKGTMAEGIIKILE